jgi:hypothetical protein
MNIRIRRKLLMLIALNQHCTIIFALLFRGGESQAYKNKPVLFLLSLGLLAATKTLFNRNDTKYIKRSS